MSLAKTLVILPLALGALLVPAASAQVRPAAITGAVTDRFRDAGLATTTGLTARADVSNATDSQVIDDVPNVTQNPLSYAMLQNGVQPHNETSTSTLGDL